MGWTIKLGKKVEKTLSKLDKKAQIKIFEFLGQLEKKDNPRKDGKPLTGEFQGFWRYRVGDYRIMCDIKDKEISIVVIRIAHRKEVYK